MENQPTPFEELFLDENWPKMEALVSKYITILHRYDKEKLPQAPSLLAADLGLTIEEYTEFVIYFNEQYHDDVKVRIEEEKSRSQRLTFDI